MKNLCRDRAAKDPIKSWKTQKSINICEEVRNFLAIRSKNNSVLKQQALALLCLQVPFVNTISPLAENRVCLLIQNAVF